MHELQSFKTVRFFGHPVDMIACLCSICTVFFCLFFISIFCTCCITSAQHHYWYMFNVQMNGIAYDWSSGNVYWTDGELNLIGATYEGFFFNLPGGTVLPRFLFQKRYINGATCQLPVPVTLVVDRRLMTIE